jgi:hypothetical protein
MTLKKKLSLGLGFLFMIIFTLVIASSYYIQKLSRESEDILRKNYDSIVYSNKMFLALDDMEMSVTYRLFSPTKDNNASGPYSHFFNSGKVEFEKNLKEENKNITEINEKEYVDRLNGYYAVYVKLCAQINSGRGGNAVYFNELLPIYEKIRQMIAGINDVNMQAVVRKNQLAKNDSTNITIYMAVIGSICMMLAFGYIWYFPFYISNSMSFLSDKMKELLVKIGIGHELETDDELHVILQSIKLIESKYSPKEKRKGKK